MNIPAVAFSPDSADKTWERRGGKYLTFTLADEDYGISITKIREIIGMMPVTRVPWSQHKAREFPPSCHRLPCVVTVPPDGGTVTTGLTDQPTAMS